MSETLTIGLIGDQLPEYQRAQHAAVDKRRTQKRNSLPVETGGCLFTRSINLKGG
jgi:hypothetical protein